MNFVVFHDHAAVTERKTALSYYKLIHKRTIYR